MINDSQVREALNKSIGQIIENIKITLEATPPELIADIYEHGIYLSGGGALLRGLDKEIAQATKIPVRVAEDPLTCVVRGIGVLLNDHELLKRIAVI
jgi:rod shape-determining protein MreB